MAEYQHTPADEREHNLTKQARQLAQVLAAAYLEFRAAAPDVGIDQLRVSGERGHHKLVGIDPDETDEDLDHELLGREDFRWSMWEGRD
jgi:hypothetical protein